MTYTNDQNRALDAMALWIKSPVTEPADLLYTLNGAAGTGKTTVVKAFIQSLTIPKSQVAVTAPTHQAKKVISNATDFPADTIQKLLGLRPDVSLDDYNPNNPKFNPISQDKIGYYKIVIIDESSMLNAEAYKLLKSKASKHNVRLLFLGDSFQLPPVNESVSKVFSEAKHISTLEEVVRQNAENPMTRILKIVRQDVKYGTENGIAEMVKVGKDIRGAEGFKCLSKTPFGEELLNMYYSTEYKHDANHIRFLSYTNVSVETWCNALRKKVQKDSNNQVAFNEMMVGYTTIVDRKTNDVILENGEDYEIINIEKDESAAGIAGFYVKLSTISGYTTTIFIVDNNDIAKFTEVYMEKLNKAKANRAWQAYYNFKNYHLLMQDIPIPGQYPCRKDIYYSYGSTVHKAQGATFNNVALNLKNLYTNRLVSERNRLIYVALSRAENMNLILVQ